MRGIAVVLCLGLGVTFATAHAASLDDDRKACIINAAQKLPIIPGIQITKAGATEGTHLKDGETVWQVDVDFTAAGQDVRWSYLCVMMPDGNPRAQRTK